MTASRPSYAPTTRRDRLPAVQRLSLRLRGRVRRRRSVQALLDERAELLAALETLEEVRAKLATQTAQRAMEKPAARERMEAMSQKWQAKIDSHAERIRHRLLIGDGILSRHGVRPWEHADER